MPLNVHTTLSDELARRNTFAPSDTLTLDPTSLLTALGQIPDRREKSGINFMLLQYLPRLRYRKQ